MLQERSLLCEIVGEKIQSNNSEFFAWKYCMKNGVTLLQKISKQIKVDVERIKQCDNETSMRIMGVHMSPALC